MIQKFPHRLLKDDGGKIKRKCQMKRNIIIIACIIVLCGGTSLVVLFNNEGENMENTEHIVKTSNNPLKTKNNCDKGSNNHGETSKKYSNGQKSHSFIQNQGTRAKCEDGTMQVSKEKTSAIPTIDTKEDLNEWEGKIDGFLSKIDSISKDAENYELKKNEAMAFLGDISAKDLAIVLNNLTAIKTGTERLDMLYAIDALLLDERFFDGLQEDETEEIKGILQNIVGACLGNSEDDIRLFSLDMLERLPKETGEALHGIVLTGEYTDVKQKLLENHMDSDNFQNMALFFQALDNEDNDIAEFARGHVSNVLEKNFTSSAEAFEWWEANHKEEQNVQ